MMIVCNHKETVWVKDLFVDEDNTEYDLSGYQNRTVLEYNYKERTYYCRLCNNVFKWCQL
jgi:hypothetical protein